MQGALRARAARVLYAARALLAAEKAAVSSRGAGIAAGGRRQVRRSRRGAQSLTQPAGHDAAGGKHVQHVAKPQGAPSVMMSLV